MRSRKFQALAIAPLLLLGLQAMAQPPAGDSPGAAPPSGDGVVAPASADSPPLSTVAVTPLTPEPAPAEKKEIEVKEAQRLDGVVVTATKRARPVRSIPATIAVLSGEDLERGGVQTIEQVLAQVPGVNLQDDGSGANPKRVTVRGIAASPATTFTVGTLFGDIPFADPFTPHVQLDPNPFDMATVEVLKGPQGTLFGGTGLNGMLRYVPQAPELNAVHIKYFSQYDAYPGNGGGDWTYGGVVNAPFLDHTAAIRLMAFNRGIAGYTDDTRNDRKDVNQGDQYGGRAMMAWAPGDRTRISLIAALQHYEIDDAAYTDNPDGRLERGNTPRPSPTETEYQLANLGIEHKFDWVTASTHTSVFSKGYHNFSEGSFAIANGAAPVLSNPTDSRSQGLSQELRFVSPNSNSPWKWLGGLFYYQTHLYDCVEIGAADLELLPGFPLPIPNLPGPGQGLLATPCPGNAEDLQGQLDIAQLKADLDFREYAVFGEVSREFFKRLEVTLGGRLYGTGSTGTVDRTGIFYSAQTNGQPATVDARTLEKGFSPKASIAYRASRDFRAYVAASRGFRFGGPQLGASTPTTTVPETFKSDSLWNYEAGVRSDWFGRSLRVDASVYYVDWKDAQVRQQSADNLAIYIDNVGAVKGLGADFSVRYLPPFLPGLTLENFGSWNKTETAAEFDDVSGETVAKGSPWPLSPRWQNVSTLSFVLPLGNLSILPLVRYSYLGSACNEIACNSRVFGYRTVDASLSFSFGENAPWPELSVGMFNLTDKRGTSNVTTTVIAGSESTIVNYITPRSLFVRLSGRF